MAFVSGLAPLQVVLQIQSSPRHLLAIFSLVADRFNSVLSGSAPLLRRSSSHDHTLSCQQWHPVGPCIKELSAAAFGDAVLTSPSVGKRLCFPFISDGHCCGNRLALPQLVLVVHYTRWCAACAAIWPKMHSLAYLYRSIPDLLLTKYAAL